MPPSQAGMVPAALPAFSAPMGVSVVPSWARSAWPSSAAAGAAKAAATARAAIDLLFSISSSLYFFARGLERVAHGERIEVAVLERVGARAPARGLPRIGGCDRVRAAERAPAEEVRV